MKLIPRGDDYVLDTENEVTDRVEFLVDPIEEAPEENIEGRRIAINPDIYLCKVIDCTFRNSRSGNPMWQVVFQLADSQEEYPPRFWYYVTFTNKSRSHVGRFLRFIAPELTTKPFKPASQEAIKCVIGKFARLSIGRQVYEGTLRNKITGIYPATTGAPENE